MPKLRRLLNGILTHLWIRMDGVIICWIMHFLFWLPSLSLGFKISYWFWNTLPTDFTRSYCSFSTLGPEVCRRYLASEPWKYSQGLLENCSYLSVSTGSVSTNSKSPEWTWSGFSLSLFSKKYHLRTICSIHIVLDNLYNLCVVTWDAELQDCYKLRASPVYIERSRPARGYRFMFSPPSQDSTDPRHFSSIDHNQYYLSYLGQPYFKPFPI